MVNLERVQLGAGRGGVLRRGKKSARPGAKTRAEPCGEAGLGDGARSGITPDSAGRLGVEFGRNGERRVGSLGRNSGFRAVNLGRESRGGSGNSARDGRREVILAGDPEGGFSGKSGG